VQAGDTTCSVSDAYTARTARERARTGRQRPITLVYNGSDYTANDRSGSSPMTQGVAYLARNLKFEFSPLQRRVHYKLGWTR
jgi:hypothetical protein